MSERLALLYLPMGLDEFCTILEGISKAYPDAKIGEPDDDGQVLVLRATSVSASQADFSDSELLENVESREKPSSDDADFQETASEVAPLPGPTTSVGSSDDAGETDWMELTPRDRWAYDLGYKAARDSAEEDASFRRNALELANEYEGLLAILNAENSPYGTCDCLPKSLENPKGSQCQLHHFLTRYDVSSSSNAKDAP